MYVYSLDKSDENNCQPLAFEVLLAYVFTGAGIFVISAGIITICHNYCNTESENRFTSISLKDLRATASNSESSRADFYRQWKSGRSFRETIYSYLAVCELTSDVNTSIEICKKIYEEERMLNNNVDRTDTFFFKNMGSNDITDYFYSHVDVGVFVRFKVSLFKILPRRVMETMHFIEQNLIMKKAAIVFECILKTTIHYVDIIKDALIITKLWEYITDSDGAVLNTEYHVFPKVITTLLLISILMTEAFSVLVVNTHPHLKHHDHGILWRALWTMITPLMPARALFEEMLIKIEEANFISELDNLSFYKSTLATAPAQTMLSENRQKLYSLRSFRAELKAVENVLENFSQLVVYIMIALVYQSKTGTVPNLGALFLSKTKVFLVISACVSFISLVWGHISYLTARKNGFVLMVGKVVLLAYFSLSSLVRISALIMLLIPFLGVFDTMAHFKMAQYNYFSINKAVPFRAIMVYENGTITNLHEAWSKLQLQNLQELTGMPDITPIITLLVIVIIHLIAGCYLLRPIQKLGGRLFLLSVFSLICPPLYADWEELHLRNEDLDISQCWKKSMHLFTAFLILECVEHLACLLPMVALKVSVDRRNTLLDKSGFPPIEDELHSTFIINGILISAPCFFLLIALLQFFVAKIYFKHCHGWSRILRANVQQKHQRKCSSIHWQPWAHLFDHYWNAY